MLFRCLEHKDYTVPYVHALVKTESESIKATVRYFARVRGTHGSGASAEEGDI